MHIAINRGRDLYIKNKKITVLFIDIGLLFKSYQKGVFHESSADAGAGKIRKCRRRMLANLNQMIIFNIINWDKSISLAS